MTGVISIGVIIPQFFFYPDVPARQKPDLVFTEAVSKEYF
jgi:ACS family pantothenate transporter-like MFS transporter